MTELHAALAPRVAEWRDAGHAHDRYSAIAGILGYALEGEPPSQLRYLRALPVAIRITDMLGEEILVVEDRPRV